MGTEHIYFSSPDGQITGHMACSTLDAVFHYDGNKVLMYFHNYMGPTFEMVKKGDAEVFYPGEEPEFDPLWKQFDGWWDAKGRALYK